MLDLVSAGEENPQIAQHLGIAVGTVKNHVEHALHVLDAPNRTAAAVKWALKKAGVEK